MDDNYMDNKYISSNSPRLNSSSNMKKGDYNQGVQPVISSPKKTSKTSNLPTTSSTSINNRMNNIAKLRQQFVEEVKDVEIQLKESIQNLKLQNSEASKKADDITEKLRQANKHLCNHSEIIYSKEQENKILRENIKELHEYQKQIYENIEYISNIVNVHENLSIQLTNQYESVILMQCNDIKVLEEDLKNITPDERFLEELNEISVAINEQERESIQFTNEITQLELDIKAQSTFVEEQKQKLHELDIKINELELRNKKSAENRSKEKSILSSEIENLKQKVNDQRTEDTSLDKIISKLQINLEKYRNSENEIQKKVNDINQEINVLIKENEHLDSIRYKDDQESTITLEKLKEQLKTSQKELASTKQKQTQATNVLQKKISELNIKLKNYEGIDQKLKDIKVNINKEEELILQITRENEIKKQEYSNRIQLIDNKTSEIETKIDQADNKLSESEKKIKLLEQEIQELNKQSEIKLVSRKISSQKHSDIKSIISQYDFPDLFVSEANGNSLKQKNRKKLYTPTLADDDLESDSLPIEEQYTRLTQSVLSQSPEKNKKFFKTLSQSKNRRDTSTPRGKGKNKKN